MSLAKKIVVSVVAAALIIVSCVFGISIGPKAGRGGGTDATISNLKQFKEVLNVGDKAMQLEMGASENSYSSFTFTEIGSVYITSESNEDLRSGSLKSEGSFFLDKTLKIYYTQSAVLYISAGRMYSTNETEGSNSSASYTDSEKVNMDFSVKVYMDNKGKVLLYIEKLYYSSSRVYTNSADSSENIDETEADTDVGKVMRLLSKYRFQWIDCSFAPVIAKTFTNVNNNNMQYLSKIGDLIQEDVDAYAEDEENKDNEEYEKSEKNFYKKGDKYTLKSESFKKLLDLDSGNSSKTDFKGKFVADLSDKTAPELEYSCSAKVNVNSEYTNGEFIYVNSEIDKSYLYLNVKDKFENIDNTVVDIGNVSTISIMDIAEEMAGALGD